MMKRAMTCVVAAAAGCALLWAPGPARGEVQTVGHTIRSGDNLHLIAGYYYGDPRQWKRIWRLNRKAVPAPSRLVPGRVLRIEPDAGEGWQDSYEDFVSRVRGK